MWASKTRDEVISRPASVKMELLGPLEQQAWREHEDGTAGATGAAGTAEAEEKIKQSGSESPLEVKTSNVQWVEEPPRLPRLIAGVQLCLTHEDLVVSWGGICCGKELWHA